MESNSLDRYCTVSESLEESLKQMKLIRQGRIKMPTWNEYMCDLRDTGRKLNKLLDLNSEKIDIAIKSYRKKTNS